VTVRRLILPQLAVEPDVPARLVLFRNWATILKQFVTVRTGKGFQLRGLIFGILAFAGSVTAYALVVRCWRPRVQARLIGPILFLGSAVVIIALGLFDSAPGLFDEALLGLALSWSLAVAYLVANTAIETDSPTQSLILFLHDHRPKGLTEDMVERFISERNFRDSRLEGLINDGLVEYHCGRLSCRSGGRLFLDLLDAYRRVIRRTDVSG
jgi:hypothetical protein